MALISATVEAIGDEALTSSIIDRSVTEIQDEIVTSIPQNGLYGCTALTKAVLAGVTNMGNYAMQGCTALKTLDLHQKITFGMDVLKNCSALTALILRSSEAISLRSGDIFGGTPIASGAGYIYVPSALVESYTTATHWSKYANQIRAIEDYPEVCSNLGKVWLAGDTPVTSTSFGPNGIAYGDGKFVAIYNATRDWDNVFASTDGETWTRVANMQYPYQVAYENGLWVIASNTGIHTSTDGITWTLQNGPKIYSNGRLVYHEGLWVLTSADGYPYFSTDGVSWTTNATERVCRAKCIDFAGGVWVMCGDGVNDKTGFWYSVDGKTWAHSNITSGGANSLAFVDGAWMAVSSSQGIYTSTDGINWTLQATHKPNYVCCGEGVVLMSIRTGTTAGIYYSADKGQTWTRSQLTMTYISGIHYLAGMFIACHSSGLYYSYDGIAWEQSDLTESMACVTYGKNMMVAIGSGKPVYRSEP